MKFTVFAAFLFSIGWMSVEVTGTGRPVECCNEVKKNRIPVENIMQYDIQEITSLCYVRAVRFHTKKNKVICSDPVDAWAIRAMRIVDGRTTTKPFPKPITCYTSTTNMIPTTATTDKTSSTKTKTSMSTTVTPAVMTIRTSETETSTSITVPTTVTAIKTSRLKTTIRKPTTLQPSVSKEKPESTATTCGTGETTAPLAETTTTATTTTTTTSVTKKTKKLSKMIIRKKGKSKKLLRKIQMGIQLKTTRHPNKTSPSV